MRAVLLNNRALPNRTPASNPSRESERSMADLHGVASLHVTFWRISKPCSISVHPCSDSILHPVIRPMSNMVNQQLQSGPLHAGDEGTGKSLPSILPIALQDYRCPFTRYCISYIYLLCSIHPRREVLRLESDLTGVPSLNLSNCLGPSGFSVLRDM